MNKINEIIPWFNNTYILKLSVSNEIEIPVSRHFLPEFKKAAYFLKIEGEKNQIKTDLIIQKLKTIDQVSTVYAVEKSQIKSKNNLIF